MRTLASIYEVMDGDKAVFTGTARQICEQYEINHINNFYTYASNKYKYRGKYLFVPVGKTYEEYKEETVDKNADFSALNAVLKLAKESENAYLCTDKIDRAEALIKYLTMEENYDKHFVYERLKDVCAFALGKTRNPYMTKTNAEEILREWVVFDNTKSIEFKLLCKTIFDLKKWSWNEN